MTIEYHYKQRGRDEQLSVRKGYRGTPANSLRAGKQWLGRSLLNFSTHPPTPKNMASGGVGQAFLKFWSHGRFLIVNCLFGALLSTV